jgi:hypothetical protein
MPFAQSAMAESKEKLKRTNLQAYFTKCRRYWRIMYFPQVKHCSNSVPFLWAKMDIDYFQNSGMKV